MTEAVREDVKEKGEHCPYCHAPFSETTGDAPDPRVACAGCGAEHHAACFVEHTGCSVMGCGGKDARTEAGAAPLAVGLLAAALERGELAGEKPRTLTRSELAFRVFVLLLPVAIALAFGLKFGAGIAVTEIIFAFGAWFFLRTVSARPRRVDAGVVVGGDDLVVVSQYGNPTFFPANPYEKIRQEIEAQAPEDPAEVKPPAPTGPAPAHCQACKGALDDLGDVEDKDALRFCYHCGASLA